MIGLIWAQAHGRAIGAGGAVVGCGTFCNYPAEVSEIAKVGSGNEMNVEQILALEPDLVVMTKMGHTEEQVAALEEKGLPVLVTDAQTIADTYECLKLLGQVTGREAEAEAVAAGMQERLEAVAAKVQESGLTVYGLSYSPVTGAKGNIEYLLMLAMEKMDNGEDLPADAIYLHLRAVLPKNKL